MYLFFFFCEHPFFITQSIKNIIAINVIFVGTYLLFIVTLIYTYLKFEWTSNKDTLVCTLLSILN